jgi:phospholipid/cholesterol/gamma-HCH transport system substrate-binding protein
MENKAHAMAAGAFVLVVTALLALLAIWLTRDNTQRDLYDMSTSETVSGLQPQAAVRFRGVPVGKVELIGFDTKVKGNVLIRVSIDRGAPSPSPPSPPWPRKASPGWASSSSTTTASPPSGCGQRRRPAAHPAQARRAGQAAQAKRGDLQPGRAGQHALNKLLSDENQKAVSGGRQAAGRRRRQHGPRGQGHGADGGHLAGAVARHHRHAGVVATAADDVSATATA